MNSPSARTSTQPYVEQVVARIEHYFKRPQGEALVIGVFGEWGSGKSYFLERVGEKFADKSVMPGSTPDGPSGNPALTLTVRFNPWRFERETHLLVPLLKTAQKVLDDFIKEVREKEVGEKEVESSRNPLQRITALLQRITALFKCKTRGRPLYWLVNRATILGKCTLALTKMAEFKTNVPILGEIKLTLYDALKAFQEQIDRTAKQGVKSKAAANLESLYYDLHNALEEVTCGTGDEDDNHRLNFLFLIDDIDRCLPDKAVEMLESIKLFLDVPGCAFVLALDDEVVERGIAHRYRDYLDVADRGADSIAYALKPERYEEYLNRHSGSRLPPITGHEYLEKIIQLPFRLPRWSRDEVRAFLRAQYSSTFPTMPTSSLQSAAAPSLAATPKSGSGAAPPRDWLLELFVQAVPPVPRKLIRAVELLEFNRGMAKARGLEGVQDYTLAQMVLLQLFAPHCFRYLRRDGREAWLTFAMTIKDCREGRPTVKRYATTPGYTSLKFFDWWEAQVDPEEQTNPAEQTYNERVVKPFIGQLRQAVNSRSGFDPRNLFLTDDDRFHSNRYLGVDPELEPYFTLFEPPRFAPPQPTRGEPDAAAPRELDEFVSKLLGASREGWLNALSSETALQGRVLDNATFEMLLGRVCGHKNLLNTHWLEVVLQVLSSNQAKRLYRETALVARLLNAAAMTGAPDDAGSKR